MAAIAKGAKVTVLYVGSISPEHVVVTSTETSSGFSYAHPNGATGFRYYTDENENWVRGHDKRAAVRLVRGAISKIKREKQQHDRETDKYVTERMQHAARVVAQAKLPREFRAAAFEICLRSSMVAWTGLIR